MPRNENQIIFRRAFLAPLEIMLELRRLPVLVGAEEANIQIIAWILEIIRVTAEEGNLLLGRENKANIGVALELVKVIKTALIKSHDITPQPCFVLRLLFNLGHHGPAGLESRLVAQSGL